MKKWFITKESNKGKLRLWYFFIFLQNLDYGISMPNIDYNFFDILKEKRKGKKKNTICF